MRLDFAWSFRCSASILAGVLAVMVGCSSPSEKECGFVRAGPPQRRASSSPTRRFTETHQVPAVRLTMPIPTPPVPPTNRGLRSLQPADARCTRR